MSLPSLWIDKIFQKLSLTFGRDFLGRWEGIDIEDVKADWAHELAWVEAHPQAISYALQNLTAKPPTVHDFRAACLLYNAPTVTLDSPPAKPELVAKELAKIAKPVAHYDFKAWARILKARDEAGERLNSYQIGCYKQALRIAA